jgi:penicillin amidase
LPSLSERYGEDPASWRWGQAHYAKGAHRPFGEVGLLRRFFNVEVESGGGPFTLDRGRTQVYRTTRIPMPTPMPPAIAASSTWPISIAPPTSRRPDSQATCSRATTMISRGLWADVNSIQIPAGDVADPVGVWSLSPAQ